MGGTGSPSSCMASTTEAIDAHCGVAEGLEVGAPLSLRPDPENPEDPEALAVFAQEAHIGFAPRYLRSDLNTLSQADPGQTAIVVTRRQSGADADAVPRSGHVHRPVASGVPTVRRSGVPAAASGPRRSRVETLAAEFVHGRAAGGRPQPQLGLARAYDPCLSCSTHALGMVSLEHQRNWNAARLSRSEQLAAGDRGLDGVERLLHRRPDARRPARSWEDPPRASRRSPSSSARRRPRRRERAPRSRPALHPDLRPECGTAAHRARTSDSARRSPLAPGTGRRPEGL